MQCRNIQVSLPDAVKKCLLSLQGEGHEAYIVGGAVRDVLLGRAPFDFDVATSALPEKVAEIFSQEKVFFTGLSHGTVTVVIEHFPVEITTFRSDGEYSDHRHPETVFFCKDIKEDVKRRDFTVNGLAMDADGKVFDHVGGLLDLEKREIRCIGNAPLRFSEDGLRVLRAIRFSSVLDFSIEEETRKAIMQKKEILSSISAERIWKEFVPFICGPRAATLLEAYWEVFLVFMPELLPMKGFDQKNPYHDLSVLGHTCKVISHTPPEKELRLAALFHDIGKPLSFSEKNGIGHFYGHQKRGAHMAKDIMLRLKVDTKTREYVEKLVLYHDLDVSSSEKIMRKRLSRFGAAFVRDILLLQKADALGQSEKAAYRIAEWEVADKMRKELLEKEGVMSLKTLAINGSDLLTLGIPSGRVMGKVLSYALTLVLEGETENQKEMLLFAVEKAWKKGEIE